MGVTPSVSPLSHPLSHPCLTPCLILYSAVISFYPKRNCAGRRMCSAVIYFQVEGFARAS